MKALNSEKILALFLLGFQAMDFYGTQPFRWNRKTHKLEQKSRAKLFLNKLLLLLCYMSIGVAILQISFTWVAASTSVRAYCLMSILIYVMGVFSTYVCYRFPTLLLGLFNGMISHEKRYFPRDSVETQYILSLKVALGIISTSSHSLIIPYLLSIIVNPCFPIYNGFWIVGECRDGGLGRAPSSLAGELGEKLVIAGVTYLLNWIVFLPALHFQCCLIIYQGYQFQRYIQHYSRKMLSPTFTLSKSTSNVTHHFREIQLMIILHRELNASNILLSVLLCGSFTQVTALYNCIDLARGTSQMPAQLVIFCFGAFLIGFLVYILGYGFLALAYHESLACHGRISSVTGLMKNRWFRRFHRSCPILKVYFGSQNYLEPLTPLNIEQFMVGQTVSLLLLK